VSSADPYQTLGVKRHASPEDIRKAYRRLAKKLHPDVNPGDTGAEQRFKDVSAAYNLLSDADQRARFDRGETDASGAERPRYQRARTGAAQGAGRFGEGAGRFDDGAADFGGFGTDDLFSDFFGRGGGTSRFGRRGQDVRTQLEADFLDTVNGASKRVTLPHGETLDITIPPGTRDGQILRLRGKGMPGRNGPPGDMLVEIDVRPHRFFTREGDDIHLELPVSLTEAALGARVQAPTPTGPVALRVPKGSNTGTVLRLKGKGVRRRDGTRGDEYATLKVVLPDQLDPELENFAARWPAGRAHHPWQTMIA
jgi:DnaJ-class molecular chaperone